MGVLVGGRGCEPARKVGGGGAGECAVLDGGQVRVRSARVQVLRHSGRAAKMHLQVLLVFVKHYSTPLFMNFVMFLSRS